MKLSKLAEALSEGWHAFRVTLSAKPRHKTTHYYQTEKPKFPLYGDVWVIPHGRWTYIWTGLRWKEIEFNARFELVDKMK